MTKSEIFNKAHRMTRDCFAAYGKADYRGTFALSLRMIYQWETEMTIEELKAELLKIDGVQGANIWQKHGKSRIYIELPKKNGGKNWNGGKAGTVFFDENENQIIYKGDWAGAATRNRAWEVLDAIEDELGISYRKM